MQRKYQRSLFLFRRDFRFDDNTGLISLLECSDEVIPAFIFDSRQTDPDKNDYFSAPAFQFLLNSLRELDQDLNKLGSHLYVFFGDPKKIVTSLLSKDHVEAIFVNKDYTPFSRRRDKELYDVCSSSNVVFERYDDFTLAPIEDIRTGQDKLYTVFTPFMRNAMSYPVRSPQVNTYSNYFSGTLNTELMHIDNMTNDIGGRELLVQGGRTEGLKILQESQYMNQYQQRRNLPYDHGTSRLSAHHKFGTVSIRESYYMAASHSGTDCHYISELYWRDFYYYIAYHFPLVFSESFLPWAKHIDWINDEEQFEAWCRGKTGVPLVDAGMRELNHTGWMHNRTRMVVASYLTKNLLIDWRWGEKYFAQNLIDYDPAQNNGGWQWSASTGADPRPLRIFNPFTQAQKYDPDARYIQKWVPELRDVDPKKLTDGKTQDFSSSLSGYPSPIVDQKETFHQTMRVYREAKEFWRDANEQS